jgi:hypothetical protein
LNGFTDLLGAWHGGPGEIRNGPCDLQNPIVRTRRPAEALAGLAQQRFAGSAWPANFVYFPAAQFPIGFTLPRQLPLARGIHP